jgi:hypothetical protein
MLPQVPADAQVSEAADLTLAEPVRAAAALVSALHDARPVRSDSEVPKVCTVECVLLRLTRFDIWYFVPVRADAGPRRSDQQRERSFLGKQF